MKLRIYAKSYAIYINQTVGSLYELHFVQVFGFRWRQTDLDQK